MHFKEALMKRFEKFTAILLLLPLALSACSTAPKVNQNSDGALQQANQTESLEQGDPLDQGEIALPKAELADKKVTVYCWSEYFPEKEFEWESRSFVDHYGGEVETILSSGDYYENFYKLIAAGEIPDIMVAEAQSFPNMIMRGLVQPWDPYLAYDDPIWDETGAKGTIEEMRFDGQIYNLTAKAHTLGTMFYNLRIIEENGLEDPAELQARGAWDWDAFRELLDQTTMDVDGDGAIDVYGIVNTGDFPLALFASTGETHIEFSGSKFFNNLKSQKVRDAADFLYEIGVHGEGYMKLGDPIGDFLNGNAAFVFTNDYRGYVDYSALWETDGLGVVPMPAYPGADAQWQMALADNWWLMKGAKNPEGAALLMLCDQYDRVLSIDPNAASARQTLVNEYVAHGFTKDAAEATVSITQDLPVKIVFSRCVRLPDGNLEYYAMDQPWTTLADSASGAVDKAIADAVTPMAVE
jgi:ABC-type glycerol-3-phosphate transport system substrate-binding protein